MQNTCTLVQVPCANPSSNASFHVDFFNPRAFRSISGRLSNAACMMGAHGFVVGG